MLVLVLVLVIEIVDCLEPLKLSGARNLSAASVSQVFRVEHEHDFLMQIAFIHGHCR